jgi:Cof subfamily protein (haloacid dehalogenase superfamily)
MTAEALPVREYRLVALDLDGTLLNKKGEISPEDAAALVRFHHAGGVVVLASGRMTDNIRPFYDVLGIDGPTIAYNGALVRESRGRGLGTIQHTPLPARYSDALIDYAREERLHLNYYYEERLYAREDPELRRFADLYSAQTGAVYHFLPDLEQFRGHEPTKAIIVTDPTVPGEPHPRHRDELYAVWHARWVDEVTVMRTNPEYLEFFHREAGKGRAMDALCRHYGIDQSLTLAFGDNYNDVSMLAWAGCGIAVANATAEARAAAAWHSPRSHDESAVADGLARAMGW